MTPQATQENHFHFFYSILHFHLSIHATLPGLAQGPGLAGLTMTGSLPPNLQPPYMTPTMGARDISSLDQSSGYPTRPGTAASDLDTLYMGSPQISGTLFRSFPKPQSSPKMKLRLSILHILSID